MASAAGTPEIRPEGYTELLGDIVISCTGGPVLQVGSTVPTTNIIVYVLPSFPFTNRYLGPSGNSGAFVSDALLLIDDPGSNLSTGAKGGYGPQAPQSLCTTAQQWSYPSSPCQAQVGIDNSGQYEVAVVPGTYTPAQNVYQGEVGDFGANSVTFYGVPVLPPATAGVSRTFRITNLRFPAAGTYVGSTVQAIISASPNQVLPVAGTPMNVAVVGPSMAASVNASPAGGGSPFAACIHQASPTLAAQVSFTEGFATSFKTRVVPGGNTMGMPGQSIGNTTYAAEGLNLSAPANQNIPGGLYGGFADNIESVLILPALTYTDTNSNITYTAGLADFGTRLKAVFSNIPAGVTVYVSTTSSNSVAIPGGTSTTPYAVLVAASQSNEANGDGANFAPLTSTIVGSDGLFAYPLAPDNSGATAAIWEVVNSNPGEVDNLTFSVYVAYGPTLGTNAVPTNVALSYSPEPGGGSFSTSNALNGLDSPVPRFGVTNTYGGPFATITYCELTANTSPVSFSYIPNGSAPPSQTVSVNVAPSSLPVTVTPTVTTPSGGTWLSASLSGGSLTISANPSGLAASPTAYSGTVTLAAAGVTSVIIPINVTVYPQSNLTIIKSHTGNFIAGQLGATYTISVSNGATGGPTSGTVTVTDTPPVGMSLVSMSSTSNIWNCSPSGCSTGTSLPPGQNYPDITVTANVSSAATPLLTNLAMASGGNSSTTAIFGDSTNITPFTCIVTTNQTPGIADVQQFINAALGVSPPTFDLTSDGMVNIADVQIVLNAAVTGKCTY